MANKRLFSTKLPAAAADAKNEAGGLAYRLQDKEALAQYVLTGCFNNTFYATDGLQVNRVVELAQKVDAQFLADLAVYARRHAYMKDSPALLLAVLSLRHVALFKATFALVIDNAKMLRNFVQIMRSGIVGRRSLGSAPKSAVVSWLQEQTPLQLLNGAVGNDPSLKDVIKMVHPKPVNAEQEAVFAYLIGREYDEQVLPCEFKAFEAFKAGKTKVLPKVDFRLLTGLPLTAKQWKTIALDAKWQMTRMNLNTFARHQCFEDKGVVEVVAERLADAKLVRNAKAFPYQLLMAYTAANVTAQDNAKAVPREISEALQDAMQHALVNVPALKGKVYVLVDVSGSMQSPVTGYRASATTRVRCIDVAALFAAALLKSSRNVEVIPFDTRVHEARLNPRDSVMTLAKQLASYGGGGTACGAPLAQLNKVKAKADAVIYFSDNESWADRPTYGAATSLASEWVQFKRRNPAAKLVLTDLQPYGSSQAKSASDVLNVGGFSDQVFNVIEKFLACSSSESYWADVISQNAKFAQVG